jgi:dephospho-CoA kinase
VVRGSWCVVPGSYVKRLGLTGGIATGKSHVRARFEALGVPTVDADTLARDAVAPGSAGLDAVLRRFGSNVRNATGGLDRKKLGAIVFADREARHDLEQIIHPFVRRMTDQWFASLDPARHTFAIADIPLLFEAGRESDFDQVIVVACDANTQLQRLMARDGLNEEEARARIAAQWPLADKIAKADYVIRTDGTFDDTNRQVDAVASQLRST